MEYVGARGAAGTRQNTTQVDCHAKLQSRLAFFTLLERQLSAHGSLSLGSISWCVVAEASGVGTGV